MQLISIGDPLDQGIARNLLKELEEIPRLTARWQKIQQVATKRGSEQADDDRRTAWLQLSHFVEVCFNMAIDNLEALRVLLVPEPGNLVLRQTAHYPNLRAAMEAASLGLWLVQSDDARTRIVRLLCARVSDLKHAQRLDSDSAAMFGTATKEHRSMAARVQRESAAQRRGHLSQIRRIAAAESIVSEEWEGGQPGYQELISTASTEAGHDGEHAGIVWRIISGFTHPSALRTAHFSSTESVRDNEDGTQYVLWSSNPLYVAFALLVAMSNLRAAVEIYAARKIRPAPKG